MSKIPVCNFAKANQKSSNVVKARTNIESMRDSFVQLLITIADETNVDMDDIMSYPITQCPLSIAYSDGEPIQTSKSALMRKLEEFQTESDIQMIDNLCLRNTVIDGEWLIHA